MGTLFTHAEQSEEEGLVIILILYWIMALQLSYSAGIDCVHGWLSKEFRTAVAVKYSYQQWRIYPINSYFWKPGLWMHFTFPKVNDYNVPNYIEWILVHRLHSFTIDSKWHQLLM